MSKEQQQAPNKQNPAMIIVVMGVSGSGKTTIGTMLADAIHCSLLEGDSLHSKENIEKMSHGVPLTSALKQQYRQFLSEEVPIIWVYLKGSEELIRSRMKERPDHFMSGHASQPV